MKYTHAVRYEINNMPCIVGISDYIQLLELLEGDAKNSIVETRVSNSMPKTWHDEIVKHNKTLK